SLPRGERRVRRSPLPGEQADSLEPDHGPSHVALRRDRGGLHGDRGHLPALGDEPGRRRLVRDPGRRRLHGLLRLDRVAALLDLTLALAEAQLFSYRLDLSDDLLLILEPRLPRPATRHGRDTAPH